MRLLLDTCAFLWFAADHPRLSARAKSTLESPGHQLVFSVASAWEMAIKVSLGKLTLALDVGELVSSQLRSNGLTMLGITLDHLDRVSRLPFHHRDPFDRLLVAQCLVEGLVVVSADPSFDAYGVERLW